MENDLKRKPSKNAPCQCGSGEKYKKCCMGSLQQEKEEYFWLLQKERAIKDKIMFAQETLIKDKISFFLQKFMNETNQSGELKQDRRMQFFDWLFYDACSEKGEKFGLWVASNF